jgi:hypothetical protein
MYIVPIAIRQRCPGVKQVFALLERNGTYMISVDATQGTAIEAGLEFAELNGLALSAQPLQADGIIFLPVDIHRTDFSAFYTWREVLPGTAPSKEVWRQFIWVSDSLNVNTLLNQISIGHPDHTAYSVLTTYLKTFD